MVWEAPEATRRWHSLACGLQSSAGVMADWDQRPGYLWCGTLHSGPRGVCSAGPQGPSLQLSIACLKTFILECQGEGETESAPLQHSLGNRVSEEVNDLFPLTQYVGGQAHRDRFLDTLGLSIV